MYLNRNFSVSRSMYRVIFFSVLLSYSIAMNNETDRLALLDFKSKISDPLGVLNSWNDTVNFCRWYGVSCGHKSHRVTGLKLQSLGLGGSISPYVGNLSFLTDLELYNNSLVGEIPSEIGRLHRLQYLLLHNNSIEGHIPSNISACSSLIQLRVPNNKLVGGIPTKLGFMPNLRFLSLNNNNLSGNIPASLGNLTSLSILSVTGTNLVGSIPESLGQLTNLSVLSFFNNLLSGSIPSSIFNLSKLTGLDLGFNNLVGYLPADLGITLPNLQILYAGTNLFSGSIPASVSNISNLEQLQLNDIGLTGEVPSLKDLQNLKLLDIGGNFLGHGKANDLSFISSLTNASLLTTLSFGDNKFGGTFPESLCNLSSRLTLLKLGYNNVSGHIPPCIGNFANLQEFSSRFNQFSGSIPSEIGKLQNLAALFLNENQLSGHIPSSVGNLSELTLLDLSNNNLQGPIPSSLGNCRNLLQMSLYFNNLSGSIPLGLLSLPLSAYKLILSKNRLTGTLPAEVASLKNLVQLEISENLISGDIPSTLGSCSALEILSMGGNLLQGAIPSSFGSLKNLQYLDLSRNNLSGEIPNYFASFPLQMLNLSYNNLEGDVPVDGIFSNSSIVSVTGNKGLCGGISKFMLPQCKLKSDKERKSKHSHTLVIAIVSGVLGTVMLVAFALGLVYVISSKKRRQQHNPNNPESSLRNLSYRTLSEATNGFSEEYLVGTGSFGSVYKADLDEYGTVVAVKVLHLERSRAVNGFIAECEVLKNVRHRNLIKLITACSGVDYSGNEFKALVYEFMTNGSLEDWLHPTFGHTDQGTITVDTHLNLHQRLDIAVDIASAIEYLHHYCQPSVIHCDLKPSNILLDAQMVGHIGDFGLAKFLADGLLDAANPSNSTSTAVRGTVGYACPEYGLGNEVSTYGDIYSFGILVLEMFTGKKPTDDMFRDGLSLHDFVRTKLPDRLTEILDPTLNISSSTSYTSDDALIETLITVLGIGLACSADHPRERMDTREAAAKLSSCRTKILKPMTKTKALSVGGACYTL